MTKPNLFILGTLHSSKYSKNKLKLILDKQKFDLIFTEGVHGKPDKSLYILEPALMFFLYCIYFKILNLLGSEFRILLDYAKSNNISYHNIDYDIEDLILIFHKDYNYLVYTIIFAILYFLIVHSLSILALLVVFLLSLIFYMFYFLVQTWDMRNNYFKENIENNLQQKFENALLVCGNLHCKFIKERFKEKFNIIDV